MAHGAPAFAGRIQPPQAPRRIILNDDGHGGFYSGILNSAKALRKHPQRFRDTHLWIYQWGVMMGQNVNYPSKVAEICGTGVSQEVLSQVRSGDRKLAELLARLAAEGVDTLQCVAQGCHEAELLCYASIRANSCYPLKAAGWPDESMARFYNGKFWWAHPEYRIRLKDGREHVNLSYAFPAVHDWKLSIVREVLERDIDGIDLDFFRHPPFLGYEEPLLKEFTAQFGVDPKTLPEDDSRWLDHRCRIMTDFMRQVRKAVDAAAQQKKRPLGVSARVDHKQSRRWGLDIATWMKEGLVDILVVGQYGYGGYTFDLTPFVKMAQGTGCLVFFSQEACTAGRDPTPQDEEDRKAGRPIQNKSGRLSLDDYCNRARNWYAQGAHGIHLFNEHRIEVVKVLGDPPK